MKVQCYHFTKNGTASALAEKMARHFQLKCDKIPPSFQPEREAVVFIITEPDSAPESALLKFLNTLTVDKTKTVAFAMIGGGDKGLDKMKAAIADDKVKIHDDVFMCNVQKKMFKGKFVSDEDTQKAIDWAQNIIDSLRS